MLRIFLDRAPRRAAAGLLLAGAAATAAACSASGDGESFDNTEDGSGPGAGSGQGTGTFDGSSSGATGGSDTTCASATAVAQLTEAPADIIWVVDQSGSMDQETTYVQQKINDFTSMIGASAVDYHVVMIADPDAGNGICVPPPLAGPACGDADRFRLVPQEVDSNDGPELAITTYASYSDFLRPEATKHFVFVTDDDSDMSAAEFLSQVAALQPSGMFDAVVVHAIYAYGTPGDGCDGPFGSGAAEGTVYTELVATTEGASGVICSGDWTTVFDQITKAVLSGAKVPCDLDVPPAPEGETLDTDLVNVAYQSGSGPLAVIPQVDSEAACGTADGWYYDDPAMPTTIHLCPKTCDVVEADAEAKLQIELGCETVQAE